MTTLRKPHVPEGQPSVWGIAFVANLLSVSQSAIRKEAQKMKCQKFGTQYQITWDEILTMKAHLGRPGKPGPKTPWQPVAADEHEVGQLTDANATVVKSGRKLSPQALDLLEKKFLKMGRAGANADLKHPQRAAWEAARAALQAAGRLA